jgi:hypothetical protein
MAQNHQGSDAENTAQLLQHGRFQPVAQLVPPSPLRIGGLRWTIQEETWLVVQAMYGKTNMWLKDNLPGGNNRSISSITGHFADMRLKNKLPRRWRLGRTSDANKPSWGIDEDVEIMQWHVWGQSIIDAKVFIENNRTGVDVLDRLAFLCSHPELERQAFDIEDEGRTALLMEDMYEAGQAEDTDKDEEARAKRYYEGKLAHAVRLALDRSPLVNQNAHTGGG